MILALISRNATDIIPLGLLRSFTYTTILSTDIIKYFTDKWQYLSFNIEKLSLVLFWHETGWAISCFHPEIFPVPSLLILTRCHLPCLRPTQNDPFLQPTFSHLLPDCKVHGAHLGPVDPRRAPCWHHKPCYRGVFFQAHCIILSEVLSQGSKLQLSTIYSDNSLPPNIYIDMSPIRAFTVIVAVMAEIFLQVNHSGANFFRRNIYIYLCLCMCLYHYCAMTWHM